MVNVTDEQVSINNNNNNNNNDMNNININNKNNSSSTSNDNNNIIIIDSTKNVDNSNINSNSLNNNNVDPTKNNDNHHHHHLNDNDDNKKKIDINEWPYGEIHLYKTALHFYRDNEGKAFHPSYDQRNLLMAYTFQEKYGKFNGEKAIPLGALDFVGHDRRNAWISLDDMSKSDARKNFVQLLDKLCPFFNSYLIAVQCDLEEKERKRLELEKIKQQETEMMEKMKKEEIERKKEEEKRKQYEQQKLIIQETLNRQTYNQFSNYAKQQYPDSPELQEQLIKQLQEQHFEQYIQQWNEQQSNIESLQQKVNSLKSTTDVVDGDPINNHHQQQQQHNLTENFNELSLNNNNNNSNHPNHYDNSNQNESELNSPSANEIFDEDEDEESEESNYSKQINNASMWTRKDIVAFKESVQAEGGHGIIKVGHGEIATIRVPTHDDGSCIFWEFATDYYDIGFGLFFEWNSSPDSQVSICFSESEEDEEEEEQGDLTGHDIEKGSNHVLSAKTNSRLMDDNNMHHASSISAIIPIYRRDSHEEVFAGSHIYPGKGVYLLKFDNSYSLWRSKTLYYRVYYTKEP